MLRQMGEDEDPTLTIALKSTILPTLDPMNFGYRPRTPPYDDEEEEEKLPALIEEETSAESAAVVAAEESEHPAAETAEPVAETAETDKVEEEPSYVVISRQYAVVDLDTYEPDPSLVAPARAESEDNTHTAMPASKVKCEVKEEAPTTVAASPVEASASTTTKAATEDNMCHIDAKFLIYTIAAATATGFTFGLLTWRAFSKATVSIARNVGAAAA